jgi:peptidoglycan/xylan/chitin deacetylase (PgdA/CDA1 family)
MSEATVAVLGFHKVGRHPAGGWESWFYVSEAQFGGFLADITETGWQPIDLQRFLRGLDDPASLPRRSALLTFDDGYRSMRHVMLPTLQKFGMPAVLFVPTDFVGARNTFDAGVEPDEPICDWDDLRALAAGGVAIQSHAASHRRFSDLSRREREQELRCSKATLEGQLRTAVETIAFPYGDAGPDDERGALASAGYRAAFLYGGGTVRMHGSDRFRLQRLAMGPTTNLRGELEAAG